ncbi:MAG: DEAD/DEAH box helicase [Shewanellaceae bacterium]|nr:DEAD/DEAH box helicase [Shewanellaceae bacterium]
MSSTEVTFSDLALAKPVLEALNKLGYEKPTPIQLASIKPLQAGRDVLGQAQTGTGKTAAFSLPLLSRIDFDAKNVQVLVLAPTRELAIQVSEAFQSYGQFLPNFHVLPIYGGQSMDQQLRQLRRHPQVIVGTPGRVMDHIRRGSLKLATLKALVLDEADEMLKMGFIEDIEWILEHTPAERQLALFSATMPDAIRRVANRHLKEPEHVKIAAKTATVAGITQQFLQVTPHHKLEALSRILEVEQTDGVIIFARTRNATVELADKLEARGYTAAALHGDMNQAMREQTIDALKSGKLDIVIATDVAARGIDVPRIELVINYDIPYDAEAYVHRIGRTGRAGRTGKALLFVTNREIRMLRNIERTTGSRMIPMQVPKPTDVGQKRLERLGNTLKATLENESLTFIEQAVTSLSEKLDVTAETLAIALLYQAQKARPLEVKDLPLREKTRQPEGQERRRDAKRGASKGITGAPNVTMKRYQIDVGRQHHVNVGNIVGAIANEANIESKFIGQIKLYDETTTVDLPEGMPKDVINHLAKVRVCGRRLNIREASGHGGSTSPVKPRQRREDSKRKSH